MEPDLTEQIQKLSVADRILLAEEIWDSVARDNECFQLTDAQRTELDRRIESFQANPSQGRTWEEIKAEALAIG